MLVTVKTREELENAKNNGADEIIVVAELADELKKAQAIAKMGKVSLAILAGILGLGAVTAPVTGGVSFGIASAALTAVGAASTAGLGTAAIIAASALGIALVLAIFNECEEIEYSHGHLKLRKKQTTS